MAAFYIIERLFTKKIASRLSLFCHFWELIDGEGGAIDSWQEPTQHTSQRVQDSS